MAFSNEGRLDEWNRIESSETDPHKYSQLTFEKGAKTTQWKKDNPEIWTTTYKNNKINLDTALTHFTKVNFKLIIELIVKCEAVKPSKR